MYNSWSIPVLLLKVLKLEFLKHECVSKYGSKCGC